MYVNRKYSGKDYFADCCPSIERPEVRSAQLVMVLSAAPVLPGIVIYLKDMEELPDATRITIYCCQA